MDGRKIHKAPLEGIKYITDRKRICVICDKEFYCDAEYIYKRSSCTKPSATLFFCRYNHLREWDKMTDRRDDLIQRLKKINLMIKNAKVRIESATTLAERKDYKTKLALLEEKKKAYKEEIDKTKEVVKNAVHKTTGFACNTAGDEDPETDPDL